MKKKRPSLQDVADRVGVTKMTVSRFLRNPEQVSEVLRGKIAQAVEALGYIPNKALICCLMQPAMRLVFCYRR
ncbi:Gluconate utilization system GNT-I transcriptional repressor [Providencia stuartii]|nr:Gluconate utilization system GNT-I transcriptional repressor [Providencia stuartii]